MAPPAAIPEPKEDKRFFICPNAATEETESVDISLANILSTKLYKELNKL